MYVTCSDGRCTLLSLQIKLSEALNPIMQDVKNGKVRFVNNCFPNHGYIWNYGALPQVSVCVCVCVCARVRACVHAHVYTHACVLCVDICMVLLQTWEDPSYVDPNTQAKGDNDPLDVCEIGQRVWARGDVRQVKVLGTLALIDEGIYSLV